jgi:hypothetical protein
MHAKGGVDQKQKHGIVVCLPKTPQPMKPEDYRALTLLNTGLKRLARVLAKRLETCLPNTIHSGQYCGVMGRSILDATATVRAPSLMLRHTHKMCIVPLDFKDAFDTISHAYLYEILKSHGFKEGCIDQIKVLKGVKVGPKTTKTTIVAYAYDITILVTAEDEIPALRNAIMCYQEASGARINLAKSNAMAVGG